MTAAAGAPSWWRSCDDAVEGPDPDGSGTLFIATSKTDRDRAGAIAYLSPATMQAIAEWKRASGIAGGPLFRRVETYFDGSVRSVGEGLFIRTRSH
jgi:hypothetical protein